MPSNPFRKNYVRIAEFVTKFYLELQRKHGSRFKDETSLLATAGVLTAQDYVLPANAKMSVSEIVKMADEAVHNAKGADPLFPFILELETRMELAASPHLDRQQIHFFLIMKGEKIIKAIENTKKKYKAEMLVVAGADMFLQEAEFKSVREMLNIAD